MDDDGRNRGMNEVGGNGTVPKKTHAHGVCSPQSPRGTRRNPTEDPKHQFRILATDLEARDENTTGLSFVTTPKSI